jgi:homogentisate 1,2-dioxygenase
MPTNLMKVGNFHQNSPSILNSNHRPMHLMTASVEGLGNYLDSSINLFFNCDIIIGKSHFNEKMSCFYRNGHHDELLYIQKGDGELKTNYGVLEYLEGDFLIIPRGVISKIEPRSNTHALVVETKGPIQFPRKYLSRIGQLLEHSPYCERDIHLPKLVDPINKKGEFLVKVKLNKGVQDYYYNYHPFDVVGWDGYHYPWKLSIFDFEPIVGSIHQPPPVHQIFESLGCVFCVFVPRLFDFNDKAIPAPYPHSNVDSDEVIFYSKGNFMSRKHIEEESITFHPSGLPHGPQPGKYEESIGKKNTDELAVMIDTFSPLRPTENTFDLEDKKYPLSWNE